MLTVVLFCLRNLRDRWLVTLPALRSMLAAQYAVTILRGSTNNVSRWLSQPG